jgi:DNA-binding transcriptional MerR regulator
MIVCMEAHLRAVDDSPNQLTIEGLAHETGLSVRNLRSHQARGLLPPPEVRGRIGYYGPEHMERIRLIQELQGEGLKLDGIKRLLEESAGVGLLRVKRATDAFGGEGEGSEVITGDELRARLGAGEGESRVIERATAVGILVPVGDDLFEVPSPSLLATAEETVRRGIPLEHAFGIFEELDRHAREVSRKFVKLFLDDVWKPFSDAGMPDERWSEVAESIDQLRPLAAQAVLTTFRRTLSEEVETAYADITRQLSEGKR